MAMSFNADQTKFAEALELASALPHWTSNAFISKGLML